MRNRFLMLSLILAMILAACSASSDGQTPVPGTGLPPIVTETPSLGQGTLPSPTDISIWLPSGFSPSANSTAGQLLVDRLQAFEDDHPNVSVSLRFKAERGPGGLFETLTAASTAAPAALPDAVVLDHDTLIVAARQGLILPLEDLAARLTEPEWYAYSVAASKVDETLFGFPFAHDAEILAYRTAFYDTPPSTWSELLTGPGPFLFPVGDPEASFTLGQYIALGGTFEPSSSDPILDAPTLAEVLTYYDSLTSAGMLPLSARQYSSSSETWDALLRGQAAAAVAPFSTLLAEKKPRAVSAAPIPTRGGRGITFTQAWSWAIVSKDQAQQAVVLGLLAWLTVPDFLGPWTHALGLLPPNPASLSAWPDDVDAAIASQFVTSGRPKPPADLIAVYGPPIQSAIQAVLSEGMDPTEAAQAIANP